MANATAESIATPDARAARFRWAGLAASGDVGTPVAMLAWRDRSVQITGTFGTAEVTIEGSNDGGVTYTPLTDPQGNSLVKTAAALEAITEYVLLVRPRVSAGSGGTVAVNMAFGGNHL